MAPPYASRPPPTRPPAPSTPSSSTPTASRREYVCTNPEQAGHTRAHLGLRTFPAPAGPASGATDTAAASGLTPAETRANEEAEQRRRAEAEQAEAERREALEVAARLRATFLASTVRRSGTAHLQAVLKLLLDEHFQAWLDDPSMEDVEQLASLIDARLTPASDDPTFDDRMVDLERDLRSALDTRRSPDALAGALLAILAQDREWALHSGHGWGDPRCRRYVDFLIAQGYEPTPLERELLDTYNPETPDLPAVVMD
jgi:hypothetical protein